MNGPRIGELFSGYGGLGAGVQAVLGGEAVWHSEIDPGACKILAHRYPDVPNLGDITKVDWSQVEPVDVLTGGSPCQDLSHAGKRGGMTEGTRSNLWVSMRDAIEQLRPSLVVWENVRGAYSACADSELGSCPGCVGDGPHRPFLRAVGRVLGDLSELGFDAEWVGLRAADVGAPHGRYRVFLAAWNTNLEGLEGRLTRRGGRDERLAWPAGVGSTPDAHSGRLTRLQAVDGSEPKVGRGHVDRLGMEAGRLDWGPYGDAIRRWERRLGRPAPAPTEPGFKGQPRLSPAFVEWMQGLPAGWVTDVPGLSRKDQLKALGNGVVSQQCAAALRMMLPDAGWQVAA